MNQISKLLLWLVLILVVLGVIAGGYYVLNVGTQPSTKGLTGVEFLTTKHNVGDASRTGDYKTAAAQAQAIMGDPTKTKEEKAIAAYLAAGSEFHFSGNLKDRFQDMNTLKQIVTDETISLDTRVSALNTLASSYSDAGRDPKVFEELYKGDPWSTYLVLNEPEQSARKLYEWSYTMKPSVIAAVRISKWYAEQWVYHRDQGAAITKEYTQKAAEYLGKADALIVTEAAQNPDYNKGSRYAQYRYWKANVIGRLAAQAGEPWKSQYRSEYDGYIDYATKSSNALAKLNLFYARYTYAIGLQGLQGDKDTVAAKVQLDALAKELNALQNPYTVGYVLFLRNVTTLQKGGLNDQMIQKMSVLSPDYGAAVKKLNAGAPPTSQATTAVQDGY